MKIDRIVVTDYSTNCYLVYDQLLRETVIIDPGGDTDKIIKHIKVENLSPQIIVLTHGHLDHVGGIQDLLKAFYIPVAIHREDVAFLEDPNLNLSGMFECYTSISPDMILEEGTFIEVEGIQLEVIHTPGHTPGSIILVTDESIFSGDTIFNNGIGRTDLPGGSEKRLIESLDRIMEFPDEYILYPGHGPETTILGEKEFLASFL